MLDKFSQNRKYFFVLINAIILAILIVRYPALAMVSKLFKANLLFLLFYQTFIGIPNALMDYSDGSVFVFVISFVTSLIIIFVYFLAS